MPDESEVVVPQEWKQSISRKPLVFDLMEDMLLFCMFCPGLLLALQFFEKGAAPALRLLFLAAVIFGMTLARRLPRRAGAAFGLRIAAAAAAVLMPGPVGTRVVQITVGAVAFLYSSVQLGKEARLKDRDYEHPQSGGVRRFFGRLLPWGAFGLLYLTFMTALFFKRGSVMAVCVISLAAFLSVYEIYLHTGGVCALTQSGAAEGPSSRRFTLFFSALLGTGIGLCAVAVWLVVSLTGLGRLDEALLGLLGRASRLEASAPSAAVSAVTSRPGAGALPKLLPVAKPALWMSVLGSVLKALGILLLGIAALALLALLLRALFRFAAGFGKEINEETGSIFSAAEATEQLRRRVRRLPLLETLLRGGGDSMRVRRVYYRTVRREESARSRVSNADTPAGIAQKLRGGPGLYGLTALYEKARYSAAGSSGEDVQAAKQFAREEKQQHARPAARE